MNARIRQSFRRWIIVVMMAVGLATATAAIFACAPRETAEPQEMPDNGRDEPLPRPAPTAPDIAPPTMPTEPRNGVVSAPEWYFNPPYEPGQYIHAIGEQVIPPGVTVNAADIAEAEAQRTISEKVIAIVTDGVREYVAANDVAEPERHARAVAEMVVDDLDGVQVEDAVVVVQPNATRVVYFLVRLPFEMLVTDTMHALTTLEFPAMFELDENAVRRHLRRSHEKIARPDVPLPDDMPDEMPAPNDRPPREMPGDGERTD